MRLVCERLESRWLLSTDILTYRYDTSRSGVDAFETALTPSTVKNANFGALFSLPVDGTVNAQPLYVSNLTISGTSHNVLFVATEHDSVYAFDADSGAQLWKTSLIGANEAPALTSDGVDTGIAGGYSGITGTPVIDSATKTLYAIAKTEAVVNGVNTFTERLHALDITTGVEKPGGPTTIAATVPGTSEGGTTIAFNAYTQLQRTGLALVNGVVYAGWCAGNGVSPWHGWVMGFSAQNLQQVAVFCDTPNGPAEAPPGRSGAAGAGIWMSGGAPAVDSDGNLYYAIGDGNFDPTLNDAGFPANGDYGDSFVKLTPDSSTAANPNINGWGIGVTDYFAPSSQATLNNKDLDLGSGGLLMLTNQPGSTPNELIGSDKSGTIYIVNRDHMGKYNTVADQAVQEIPGVLVDSANPIVEEDGSYGTPAVFNNVVYFHGANDVMKAFTVANGQLQTTPAKSGVVYQFPGATPVVSANGTNNAIIWETQYSSTANGLLNAYDPANLGSPLFDGTLNDFAVKFTDPVVDNGRVYVGTRNSVAVFGLHTNVTPTTAALQATAPVTSALSPATLTVVYTNAARVKSSSLLTGNLVVSGPTNQVAAFAGSSPSVDSATITATYTVAAPPGGWTTAANGTYTVSLAAESVSDTSGNFALPATLGSFQIAIPTTAAGGLSGQAADAATTAYNLTTLGTSDWAHWGRASNAGNFDHKATGGSQISNITNVGAGANTGGYSNTIRSTTWTDGAPTGSDSNEHGFIYSNGALNSGVSFTVPADTATRTLTVMAGGADTTSTLTAHLSDSSANDVTITNSLRGVYTKLYTIVYHAGAAGQTLTVTLLKTANLAGPTSSADLIAAWLSGAPAAETIPPQATLQSTATVTSSNSPATLKVAYTDNAAVKYTSLATGNLNLTGPTNQTATFVSSSPASDNATITATYTVAAPAGGWTTAANGTYTVALAANSVSDTSSNFASAATLGMFSIAIPVPDTTVPVATLQQPATITAYNTPATLKVVYVDNVAVKNSTLATGNLTFSGPTSQTASFTGSSPSSDNATITATYSVAAPAGGWTIAANGIYTVSLAANSVSDTSTNFAAAGSLGSFQIAVPADTTLPLATLQTTTTLTSPSSSETLKVVYTDDAAVKYATLLTGSLLLSGPTNQTATFIGSSPAADNATITATYSVAAPAGGWTTAANGTYTVSLAGNSVSDTSSNFAAAGTLGSFQITIPAAGAGSLSAQSATASGTAYNLTTLGTSDWAHWGRASNAGNFDHKASGGSQISNITNVGAGANTGGYSNTVRSATWTDGTPTASDSNEHGFIYSNGALNSGVSFTVPADTSTRTLTVLAGGADTTSTLTAHLSDSSANDVTITSSQHGVYTNLYTIVYHAGAAGQTLTITLLKTANLAGPTSSADLIAAWLSGAPAGDTIPPQATLQSAATVTASNSPATLKVVYTDNATVKYTTLASGNLTLTGPTNQNATFVSASPSSDNATITATYSVAAPAGGWTTANNGAYTVALVGNSVSDTSTNFALAGTLGTFQIAIAGPDTTLPQASLQATATVTASASAETLKVVYTDNVAVKNTSLATGNLILTGHTSQTATFVSSSPSSDNATITATYSVAAPVGGWTTAANGIYTVALAASSVSDTSTNFAAAASLGSFQIAIPAPGAGSLVGSQTAAAAKYNLTTLGTSDWAHWGRGNNYANFDHKATGGSKISNVTVLGSGNVGSWYDSSRSVQWSDGTPTGSNSGDSAYIWANNAIGAGYSFTVPADTTTRTLYVYAGGNASGSTLTAHLSDSSANDVIITASGNGLYTNLYTITYKAASAGKTLTISYVKSTNINGNGGSVDLIAAALA